MGKDYIRNRRKNMYLDIFVVVVLLLAIILGAKNGIFIEFLSVFGFVSSFFVSKKITPIVITKMVIDTGKNGDIIAYAAGFLVSLIFISVIIHYLKKIFEQDSKGVVVIILGAMFGLFKGIILSFILVLILNIVGDYIDVVEEYTKGSKSNEIFVDLAVPTIDKYLPDILKEKLDKIKNKKIVSDKLGEL
jgi:membrane protein required for colicin V production